MKNRKTIGVATGVTIGIIIAVSAMLIISLICTALLLNGKVAESTIKYLGMVTNTISSMIGFLIIGLLVKDRVAIRMGIGAAVYVIVAAGIKVMLLDDGLQNYWMVLLSVIISYVLSCAIYIRKGKKWSYRKSTYR